MLKLYNESFVQYFLFKLHNIVIHIILVAVLINSSTYCFEVGLCVPSIFYACEYASKIWCSKRSVNILFNIVSKSLVFNVKHKIVNYFFVRLCPEHIHYDIKWKPKFRLFALVVGVVNTDIYFILGCNVCVDTICKPVAISKFSNDYCFNFTVSYCCISRRGIFVHNTKSIVLY